MDVGTLASQISALDQGYNPADVYNKVTTQLGIPDARTRVQALQSNLLNTENAIRAVDPNVTARTSGSLVTEAQRGHLVNMERAPLTDTYNQQNQAYGTEQGNLNELGRQADTQVGLAESTYKNKRQSLADQLQLAIKQEEMRRSKEEADRTFAENQRQFNVGNSTKLATSGGSSSGAQVNPAQDFLNYIANQFKATGGQGNKKTSRQTQDAWANAWFAQNGVSKDNRQQYWNLFNKTYNRSDDPTKDWRYAK
jgi:hypothetical protein